MTTLNRDTNQVIFDFLSLDDKYAFHKYSEKYDTDNLTYTDKTIDYINNMNTINRYDEHTCNPNDHEKDVHRIW